MPEIHTVADIHCALKTVFWAAIASGKVSLEEGETLGRLLAQHASVLESGEIEERLRRLENTEANRAA